jgi:L-ascorbate metabolism protein UlaG (beta-lactamase superfamily)
MKSKPTCQVTWFGHSAFSVQAPGGKTILFDPFLDNPKAPPGLVNSVPADLILVSHAHGDHVGNAVEVARRTGATIVAIYELTSHLKRLGAGNTVGLNKGGTVTVSGISVTMVDAKHSSDAEWEGRPVPAGDPAGFVVALENGIRLYHAGDTDVFGDMRLISELHKPSVVFLPIGDLYTMGPASAAMACKLLKPRVIVPMHYGTFPALTGTPADFRKMLPAQMKSKLQLLEVGKPVLL